MNNLTPATWVTKTAQIPESEYAEIHDGRVEAPSVLGTSVVPLDTVRGRPTATADATWNKANGNKARTLWFHFLPETVAAWFNSKNRVDALDSLVREKDSMYALAVGTHQLWLSPRLDTAGELPGGTEGGWGGGQ